MSRVLIAYASKMEATQEIAMSLTHAFAGVVDGVNKLTYAQDDEHLRLIDPVLDGVWPRVPG